MSATPRYDAIVIGGGVNGLTCAAMLGKAGVRTVLVEQRDEVGGCAAESILAPGFRIPTLAHATGPIRRDVVENLQLYLHGLTFANSAIDVSSLSPDGRALTLWNNPGKTAAGLAAWSTKDANSWPVFYQSLSKLGGLVGSLFQSAPPSLDAPHARDALSLMQTLSAFRGLPKADQWRLLRWGPMAVADLVSESVDHELLRATLAADGIFGAMLGPWSAGSGLQMLLAAANRSLAWPGGQVVKGGPVAVARALKRAAERHGVEIRTGATVARIEVKDDRACGVTLASGERIEARAVVSGVDPRRTFLSLCEADHLPPEFSWRMSNYRSRGTLAKINFALSALPAFAGATRDVLAGRVRLAPDLDYLERAFDHAKYGRYSSHPWIEFTIPSIDDPSLAPPGAHVLSAYAQFAPYQLRPSAGSERPELVEGRETSWDAEREPLGDIVASMLEQYAPGFSSLVVARQVLTPLDLERGWGLTGGQIFHGELSLDQFFTMRPVLGFGGHRTPIRDLFLCSSGSHPGTGLTGGSGANAAAVVARELA